MKKKKGINTKHIIIIMIGIIVLCGIIVMVLCKGSKWLGYIESIPSFIGTMILAGITVSQQHKYEEDVKEKEMLSFKPYLLSYVFFDYSMDEEKARGFQIYGDSKEVLDDVIGLSENVSANIKEEINKLSIADNNTVMVIVLKNAGRDTATNVSLSSSISLYSRNPNRIISIMKGEEHRIILILKTDVWEKEKKNVQLEVDYCSLDGHHYQQTLEMIIRKNEDEWNSIDSQAISAPKPID